MQTPRRQMISRDAKTNTKDDWPTRMEEQKTTGERSDRAELYVIEQRMECSSFTVFIAIEKFVHPRRRPTQGADPYGETV